MTVCEPAIVAPTSALPASRAPGPGVAHGNTIDTAIHASP